MGKSFLNAASINHTPRAVLGTVCLSTFAACSSSTSPDAKQEEVKRIVEAPSRPEVELLEDAKKSYDKRLFKIASENWIALRDGYPTSYYSVLAELKVADSYFFSLQYPEAIAAYQEFIRAHSGHESVPYAKYQIAVASFMQYQGLGHDQSPLHEAITKFEELITDFPRSEYATAAKARIKDCREQLAENEAAIAEFYLRQGKVDSTTNRYEGLLANYADTTAGREKAQALREKMIQTAEVDERSVPQVAVPPTVEGDPTPPVIVSAVATTGRSKNTQPNATRQRAPEEVAANRPARSEIAEASLIADESDTASPANHESDEFIAALNCIEQADGARVITVQLRSEPIVANEIVENGNLKLTFRPREGAVNTRRGTSKNHQCHSGELTAEIASHDSEILLRTSGKSITDYTQIVLDRPYRLAVIVR